MLTSLGVTVAAAVVCAIAPVQVQNTVRSGVPSRMSVHHRPDKPHQFCHPFAGMGCADGDFCRLHEGACNSADATGICRPIPNACPDIVHPVCGCDGVTYGNRCEAHAGGVSVLHQGPCSEICGGILGVPCEDPNDFCKLNVGECCCDFQGVCAPIPLGCPDVWEPVCGCDGTTYGNVCEADAAGVSIDFLGECDSICRPSDDGFSCTPNACSPIPEEQCIGTILHLDISTGAITNLACECLDANVCHVEFGNATAFPVGECPNGQACRVSGTDTDNDGIDDRFTAECVPAPPGVCCLDITLGPLPYEICVDRDHESCEADGGTFHGEGTSCEPLRACCFGNFSNLCVDLNPFCCLGSGGLPQGPGSTCSNPGTTNSCGQACGGLAGIPCAAADEFCNLPIGQCCCDILGVCTPIPQGCPEIWAPVCGCDGVTYVNACEAAAAGVSIDHHGRCDVCCDAALEPGTNGIPPCIEGATCCADGQWHCNFGNGAPSCDVIGEVCPNLCEGFQPPGCVNTGCPEGQHCDTTLFCVPSFCSCDPATGQILCTTDCGGGVCVPDNPPCCDPDLMPGTNGLPICIEGASCCGDGQWRCNQGDGTPNCIMPGEVCSEVCGGIAGLQCAAANEFCNLPIGQCCCDILGVCTPIPQACPAIWDPVCGCDGNTYGNACEAAAASASINHPGPCDAICQPSPNGFGCVQLGCSAIPENHCFPTLLQLNPANGAMATVSCDCINFNTCHLTLSGGAIVAVGNCPPGKECEIVTTDSNGDGVPDKLRAACVPTDTGACCLDISDGPIPYETCAGPSSQESCQAQGGAFFPASAPCEQTAACCFGFLNAGFCADIDPACCLISGGIPRGPGSTCADVSGPVGCGQVCGGFAYTPCENPNEFCNLPVGLCCCDIQGICEPIPLGCPAVVDPVCGCDGMTYGNACEAAAAGVSINHHGDCTP